MEPAEYALIIALVIFNLVLGLGFAFPIARLLSNLIDKSNRIFRYFALLVGIYFIECIAFSAGMATQVFSIALAFIWGIVFGFWLRKRAPSRQILQTALYISLYSSLPTFSFSILIPTVWLIAGNNIISAEEGFKFGIPYFVPWPINTVLGFCTVLLIGTVVLKAAITTGGVSVLIHLGKNHSV